MTALQGSLLDLSDEVVVGPLDRVHRRHLSDGAWVDTLTGWVSGADELYAALRRDVPWFAERRQMYDNLVDVPRLLSFYGEGDPLPHLALDDARDALSRHYADELGELVLGERDGHRLRPRRGVAAEGDREGGKPPDHPPFERVVHGLEQLGGQLVDALGQQPAHQGFQSRVALA